MRIKIFPRVFLSKIPKIIFKFHLSIDVSEVSFTEKEVFKKILTFDVSDDLYNFMLNFFSDDVKELESFIERKLNWLSLSKKKNPK